MPFDIVSSTTSIIAPNRSNLHRRKDLEIGNSTYCGSPCMRARLGHSTYYVHFTRSSTSITVTNVNGTIFLVPSAKTRITSPNLLLLLLAELICLQTLRVKHIVSHTTTNVSSEEKGKPREATKAREPPMAYGRRTFITYQRGSSPGSVGVVSSATGVGGGGTSRSMANYRNKTIIILIVTAFYTAFLYRRGEEKTTKQKREQENAMCACIIAKERGGQQNICARFR